MAVPTAFLQRDWDGALFGQMSEYQSLDVFDTVVSRTWYEPSDIFHVLARRLKTEHFPHLEEDVCVKARGAAEKEARAAAASGEVTIEEIHQRFCAKIGAPAHFARQSRDIELALESASLRGIGQISKHLGNATAKRIYVTDTYFSDTQISEFLRSAAVAPAPVFASSQLGHSKRRGSIFQVVQKSLGGGRFQHVGDKVGADVKNARRAGWIAHWFSDSRPSQYEILLRNGRWSSQLVASAVAGAAKAARLSCQATEKQLLGLHTIGANVAGPLFVSYVDWILGDVSTDRCEKVIFLARDGQIMLRLAEVLAEGHAHPPSLRYGYASRRALYLPAVFSVGDQAWEWLESKASGVSLSVFLERFGIESDAKAVAYFEARGFLCNDMISAANEAAIKVVLKDDFITTQILGAAQSRRQIALAYFRGLIGESGTVAFVDLGWKGRLQICLERIFQDDEKLKSLVVRGYYLALVPSSPLRGRSDARQFCAMAEIDNQPIVESFAIADHGTLLAYGKEGQAVIPVLGPDAGLKKRAHALAEGMLQFTYNILSNIELAAIPRVDVFRDMKGAALINLKAFIKQPSSADVDALGTFLHSEDQGHANESELAPDISFAEIAPQLLFGSSAKNGRKVYWPEGAANRYLRKNPYARVAISISAHMGSCYKLFLKSARRMSKRVAFQRS